jgi:hypothetical protein
MSAREIGEMPMRTRHCNWETRLQIRPLSHASDGKAETRYQVIFSITCEEPRSQETDLWGDAQFLRANEERATPVMACPLSQHRERGFFVGPPTERIWMYLALFSI